MWSICGVSVKHSEGGNTERLGPFEAFNGGGDGIVLMSDQHVAPDLPAFKSCINHHLCGSFDSRLLGWTVISHVELFDPHCGETLNEPVFYSCSFYPARKSCRLGLVIEHGENGFDVVAGTGEEVIVEDIPTWFDFEETQFAFPFGHKTE